MHNKATIHPSIIDVVVDSKLPYFMKSMETLKKQTVTDFEFLLVIGWPGTDVNEYLDGQDFPFEVHRIQEPPREAYPARASANNMGLDAATGDIYIGTQDDILYPENWIESHINWHLRDDGPWFVFNRITNALTTGPYEEEERFWQKLADPRGTPITGRWQYASGHSFSLPMNIAKTLRHDERYNGFWGWEDLAFSYDAFKAGCKFVIDLDCIVIHQPHGERSDEKWARDPDEFWHWLHERSVNRRRFYEINGFEPETGVIRDEFGLPGPGHADM